MLLEAGYVTARLQFVPIFFVLHLMVCPIICGIKMVIAEYIHILHLVTNCILCLFWGLS